MPTEYLVTKAAPADDIALTVTSTGRSPRTLGLACAAAGIIGIVAGAVTLAYPAAVRSDRWSYPFGSTAQWIVSVVLAVSHLLTLAGFLGVISARPHGSSRAAAAGLWTAVAGYAGLAVCELLSGAVGTRSTSSSAAAAVGGAFAVTSLMSALGSVVAGVVILRRRGWGNAGWSMVFWSGATLIALVTPAQASGNKAAPVVALMIFSLTVALLGRTLAADRSGPVCTIPAVGQNLFPAVGLARDHRRSSRELFPAARDIQPWTWEHEHLDSEPAG